MYLEEECSILSFWFGRGVFYVGGSSEGPKNDNLRLFLMTFRGLGAHVRIELSLESQHELKGSGGSENRRFLDIFFLDGTQDVTRESFFMIFHDLGSPN